MFRDGFLLDSCSYVVHKVPPGPPLLLLLVPHWVRTRSFCDCVSFAVLAFLCVPYEIPGLPMEPHTRPTFQVLVRIACVVNCWDFVQAARAFWKLSNSATPSTVVPQLSGTVVPVARVEQ